MISLYLKTDHPLLGHFDPELFVVDLVNKRREYCSGVLVNSLLYWACQMYGTIDPYTSRLANDFCKEAEALWEVERENDTLLNLASAQFLSLAYMGQGKDHAVLAYLAEASQMGTRMGLFGVEEGSTTMRVDKMTAQAKSAHSHAAWGVFNWIILVSLFYRQPGIDCPRIEPHLPIPGGEEASISRGPSLYYMGQTLPHLCRFWSIMHEVCITYYQEQSPRPPGGRDTLLQFAEYKFRELLAWSNSLPSSLSRDEHNPHHIKILHIWFHAATLDIFRPFVDGRASSEARLKTFSSPASSPRAVFAASVNQLKRLVFDFRLNYKSSAYTILWHTALTYVANAALRSTGEDGWFFCFLLCIYGYEGLRRSWRVTEAIATGLLSMALRNGDISSATARHVLKDLRRNSTVTSSSKIRATFMVDLELAMSDPYSATAEKLAESFEENASFKDYTHIFDAA